MVEKGCVPSICWKRCPRDHLDWNKSWDIKMLQRANIKPRRLPCTNARDQEVVNVFGGFTQPRDLELCPCYCLGPWGLERDSRALPSLGILAYSHKNLSDIILCQRTRPKKEMYSLTCWVTFHFGKKEHTFTLTVTSITLLSYKKSWLEFIHSDWEINLNNLQMDVLPGNGQK